MNRIRLLLITTFVVAVTAFSSGFSVTYAAQAPAPAAVTPDSSAVSPEIAAANKARAAVAAERAKAKRAEMLKQRQDAKKYIQKVIEGQQPGAGSLAPDNTGKEGAQ